MRRDAEEKETRGREGGDRRGREVCKGVAVLK
jgi:hypothetical protein